MRTSIVDYRIRKPETQHKVGQPDLTARWRKEALPSGLSTPPGEAKTASEYQAHVHPFNPPTAGKKKLAI
jgi:hypothetical protein